MEKVYLEHKILSRLYDELSEAHVQRARERMAVVLDEIGMRFPELHRLACEESVKLQKQNESPCSKEQKIERNHTGDLELKARAYLHVMKRRLKQLGGHEQHND